MKNILKKYFICILMLCLSSAGTTVSAVEYYFYVQLTDKNNTPYSLSNPAEFLSERAIERRNYFRLVVDSTDLPVNPAYLQQIEAQGFRIHNKTKWLNGATVVTSDSASISTLENLNFVHWIEYTGKVPVATSRSQEMSRKVETQFDTVSKYGFAEAQINQIGGRFLHETGYQGEEIFIGVLDAGFFNADIMPAFERMRLENRLLGTRDFVNPQSNIFNEQSHGSNVLSTMAAYVENTYIGTAPKASYWLVRTENAALEYPMEMDFWISGIEFLDSVGIDVVNSSLGYTTFDDARMNFTQADLNGETARMSRAAEMASQKGIIVVNAAGNEGNKTWRKIGVPADARGIISVGAVTADGTASAFSSFGFTADNRIKPEIAARGTETALMNVNGFLSGNGTSFASPIIAGMMACFLQFAKDNYAYISLEDIFQKVFRSANNYNSPTEQLGYGIPDFEKAANFLLTSVEQNYQDEIYIFADSASKTLRIGLNNQNYKNAYIQVFDIKGRIRLNQSVFVEKTAINTNDFSVGIYAVRIVFSDGKTVVQKVMIR
jgi:subtilisin family serine protease